MFAFKRSNSDIVKFTYLPTGGVVYSNRNNLLPFGANYFLEEYWEQNVLFKNCPNV